MSQIPGVGPAKLPLTAENLDLMKPGNGTPWEDRGTSGAVSAYFRTVIKSMFSPFLLMDHISRPESTTDSQSFAIISCAMWGIGLLGWNVYAYITDHAAHPDWDYTWYLYAPNLLIQSALVFVLMYGWMKIGSQIYRSLGATELKRVSSSLIENCMSYSMGPSLIALIPIIGWPIAFVWIVFNQIVVGRKRLYMKPASSIGNPLLIAVGVLLIVSTLSFTVWFFPSLRKIGVDDEGLNNPNAVNDVNVNAPANNPNAVNVTPAARPNAAQPAPAP